MDIEKKALIEKLAQAEGPRRELFEEAFDVLRPDHYRPGRSGFNPWAWDRFSAMLDAEAWTSAAEMFVPEGCGVKIDRYWIAEADGPVWSCTLFFGGIPSNPSRVHEVYDAAHPSLALLAAILRAERNEP